MKRASHLHYAAQLSDHPTKATGGRAMARHKTPGTPALRRALAVLATASVALGAGAATAAATDSGSL
ncbi:hypothetical protein B7767_11675, partial [Streptomyces sp. 13-12-16]